MLSKKQIDQLSEKFTPANGVYIVLRQALTQSAGGIHLPETEVKGSDKWVSKGTIIGVGAGRVLDNGVRDTPIGKKGDNCLYSRYAGISLGEEARVELGPDVSAKDILFLRDADILAIC